MPGDKTYTIGAGVWPRSPKLTIESFVGTRIARFSLNFLETCGDNKWSYVFYVVSLLVVADPQHPGSVMDSETGLPVNPDDVPRAGTFLFIEQGLVAMPSREEVLICCISGKTSEVSFALGPTSASSVLPASGVEAQSASDRSRHSTDQVTRCSDRALIFRSPISDRRSLLGILCAWSPITYSLTVKHLISFLGAGQT